ncbi:MAG: ATP-binding protein [Pseudomonadota bacterium]
MANINIAPKIAIIVFFVAIIGMVAIDLVVVIAQRQIMIDHRIQLATAAVPMLKYHLSKVSSGMTEGTRDLLEKTLVEHRISCVHISSRPVENRPTVFGAECQKQSVQLAMSDKELPEVIDFVGRTWGVFWQQPQIVRVRVPLREDSTLGNRVMLLVDLTQVYAKLRTTQGYLFFYILINAVVLTFVGSLRIWQMTGRPIQKLAQRADAYQLSDALLFQANTEYGNDVTRLSRSLNQMMQRIETDRQALHNNVASLEKANEELKRAQSDIIRAEKLASVGRLSAGIAHEIGNPIGIVTGYLELLKKDDGGGAQRGEFIRRAEDELARINGIIRQLLDFSRPALEDRPKPFSVHQVIADVADLLSAQPEMSCIKLELYLDAANDCVIGTPHGMKQVLLNLMLNAADALAGASAEGGRHIRISTRTSDQSVSPSGSLCPEQLVITVSDDGPGIDEAHLPNIFDPFFTTKEPGKGTGLGLSVCYMIIDSAGGTIKATNLAGNGTAVIISLPMAGGAAQC